MNNKEAVRFNRKKERIERECAYGMTHFCDGTVNKSVAKEDAKPLPPCPLSGRCPLAKIRLVD